MDKPIFCFFGPFLFPRALHVIVIPKVSDMKWGWSSVTKQE